jgi:hypothetical protein
VIQLQANLTVEAQGAAGATVSYSIPSATDAVDGAVPVVCAAASGSVFALGHTTVTCTAHDAAGNVGSRSFDVLVRDTTPPAVHVPADITVSASGSAGSVVSFAVSATDSVDGVDAVTCTPASGSVFGHGHTTVTCTAHDAAGNVGSQGFDVLVQGLPSIAAGGAALLNVWNALNGLGLAQPVRDALVSDLIDAGWSLWSGNAVAACQSLNHLAATANTSLSAPQLSVVLPSIDAARAVFAC